MKIKKLSPAQQNVINCLIENHGSYIQEHKFYDFQMVKAKEPFTSRGYKTDVLMYFKASTLRVLLTIGAITQKSKGTYMPLLHG